MQQTPDNTPLPEPDVRSQAHQLVHELGQMPGKKALVLIQNSDVRQRQYLSDLFKDKGKERGLGLAISAKENSRDLLNLYTAFREIDSLGNPNKVILFVDGVLVSKAGSSINIVQEMKSISDSHNWEMPFIVSTTGPGQDKWNMEMEAGYPTFLGVYGNESAPVLDAIEARL